MLALQVLVFPLASVTMSTIVEPPALAQENVDWLSDVLATEQLSVLPLLTPAAVRLPLPLASRSTVALWQRATGGTLSLTVTVNAQVVVLPVTSAAV